MVRRQEKNYCNAVILCPLTSVILSGWILIRQQDMSKPGIVRALVLSPKLYNSKTGLLICVPLTSQVKGFPFEVELQHKTIQGVALADQVRSLDWTVRHAQKKGKASNDVVNKVRAKIKLLLKLT